MVDLTQRVRRNLLLASALACMVAGCQPAAPPVPSDNDPFGPLGWMVNPTQGRPALLTAADRLTVRFRAPAGFTGRAELWLIDPALADRPEAATPLKLVEPLHLASPPPPLPGLVQGGGRADEPLATAVAALPGAIRPGLYDLAIALYDKSADAPLRSKRVPRSVAIHHDAPAAFRFVQLSTMNVGSPTAPDFSDELVEEVNRLAPAFIITTGNYLEQAAARDDAASWRRIKQYFARFEAPVFLTLGELDHEAGFEQFAAPSRSGQFRFGPCRGVLLHDHYGHPVDADPSQFLWLDSVLADADRPAFQFLVGANDSLRLFDAWRKLGYTPRQYVLRHRISMIFVGGYSDWDFVEHAGKLADVPVHYVRTHAASTHIRGKATGVPHYRLVQVEPDGQAPGRPTTQPDANALRPYRVSFIVPQDGPKPTALHSTPVGRVKVDFDGPNDGSAEAVRLTVLNRLTLPLSGLRLKVKLKRSAEPVAAVGATVERVIERDGHREAWVRVDAPDMAAASAIVGPARLLPAPSGTVRLELEADRLLRYQAARAGDGFGYYATDGQASLTLTNLTAQTRSVWPVVRLNGNVLALRGVRPGQPVLLGAGERRTLPIQLPLALASPGEHWLIAHLADDPLPALTRLPVDMIILPQPSPATSQPDRP